MVFLTIYFYSVIAFYRLPLKTYNISLKKIGKDMNNRLGGRLPNETRNISIITDYVSGPEGSVLISVGNTKVLCNVTVESGVPRFLKGKGRGWLTAEYGMLPRSTATRTKREAVSGGQSGRTKEIQRLIGRSLRAALSLEDIGEHTITVDCDVIEADGGTRTASITGGYVALVCAMNKMKSVDRIKKNPIHGAIAAISVGIVQGEVVVDLNYKEDSSAETDMNIVMNESGHFIEIQGTAEGHAFRREEMDKMLDGASEAIFKIFKLQTEALNVTNGILT